MDALNDVFYMMCAAVVGVALFKLGMLVLPDNALTDPFKRIALFL